MVTIVEEKRAIRQPDTSEVQPREQLESGINIQQRPGVAVREQTERRPLFPYPSWPTSKPGPQVTPRLPGQKPMPGRSDQMVYEAYDQVRGRPMLATPEKVGAPDSEVNEAPLNRKDMETIPFQIMDGVIDISGALLVGKRPLSPAETGHYHYGPRGPGINTDASGSYAPYEIDPRGRPVDRPVKLYIT